MKKIALVTVITVVSISIALNIFLSLKVYKETKNPVKEVAETHPHPHTYKFVDSNRHIEETSEKAVLHFVNLKERIDPEILKYGKEENVGIFVQDTKTGAWFGINEKTGFTPASLLKMPILMAVMKRVERDEISLNDKVTVESLDLDNASGTLFLKGAGAQMTVWELMKEMILSSDNTAKNSLKRLLTEAELNAVYAHIGIPNPYLVNNDATVTPRGYIRVFKSLYLATFINPDLSEKALDLTTDTEVENLISAGIPSEVQVAHKFGEREDGLSDCGIVYHSKNPYFICIMTKDIPILQAQEFISSVSKIIYDFVSEVS